jgi:hypothetical protein
MVEPRDIIGADHLDQCASTRSSKDGCFQAHLLAVVGDRLPFPLTIGFGTLPYTLGCFPLDHEPSHSWSVSSRHIHGLRRFHGFGKALGHPHPPSALHPGCLFEGRTSIRFAENQLSPSLIGLSPLPTSHPSILQHTWVRPSQPRLWFFSLLMG